jgi:hypothetical protein
VIADEYDQRAVLASQIGKAVRLAVNAGERKRRGFPPEIADWCLFRHACLPRQEPVQAGALITPTPAIILTPHMANRDTFRNSAAVCEAITKIGGGKIA